MKRLAAPYPAAAQGVHRVGGDHDRSLAKEDDHPVRLTADGTLPGQACRVLLIEQVERLRKHEAASTARAEVDDAASAGSEPESSAMKPIGHGSSAERRCHVEKSDSGATMLATRLSRGLRYGTVDLPVEFQHRACVEGGWVAPWHVRTLIEDGHRSAVEQLAAAGDGYCLLVLAEELADHGDAERALAMIAPLAAGDLWGANRAMGCLLDQAGRVDEAIAVYRPALESAKPSAISFVARMLTRHGRGDEAYALVLPHARNQVCTRLLVEISDGLDRDDEVMAVLDDYADSLAKACDCGHRCESWRAEELMAVVLERQGRIDRAIELLHRGVRPHNSTNINVVEHLADVLARHDRDGELRDLIHGYGGQNAAYRHALHLESVGNVEGAIALLAPMAADGDRNPSNFLADILLRANRTDEAIEVLTRALPRDPECVLWSWRELMIEHGRAEEALTVVDQLAAGSQYFEERWYEARVCLLAACGRGEQALQEVAARPADQWNAAEEVSHALSNAGQLDLAVKVLEPGFRKGEHHEPMALLMSRQGRIDDALALLPRTKNMDAYIPPALWSKDRSR